MTTTDKLIFAESNLIIAAIANDTVSWIFMALHIYFLTLYIYGTFLKKKINVL